MVIFVDLDGVLTDFEGSVCDLFGHQAPGHMDSGKKVHEVLEVSTREMWRRVEREGLAFWEHMRETPEAGALLELLSSRGRIFILSSPSLSPYSVAGKIRWLQRRFGRHFRDFAIMPGKELLAAPDRVLVDDTPRYTEAFSAHGGRGLLYPTWANGKRTPGEDPVESIRRMLDA